MNPLSTLFCRTYQGILRLAANFLDFSEPRVIEGEYAIDRIPTTLWKNRLHHPLIVTGPSVAKLGLDASLKKSLELSHMPYEEYSGVCPNPTFAVVLEAYGVYSSKGCDCLIALGGGSSMDAAKAVGALAANPKKDLASFKGVLKVKRDIPYFVAIPTTAGTGSEATVAAVLVNEKTKDKFSISDPHLIPDLAVLDPSLLQNLPPRLIASTGMDALTHAIESYLGCSGTRKTNDYALQAIALVRDNLIAFYQDASNEKARLSMQKAAYLAGVSFTRAYVGYVHALAHALGGFYNVPHGYANAILLPHVLRAYGKKAHRKLGEISDSLNLLDSEAPLQEKADAVIAWIESLNESMGIPSQFDRLIQSEEDLEALSRHASKEANPLYPVPKELSKEELKAIYREANAE